jgi:hypothetical protein
VFVDPTGVFQGTHIAALSATELWATVQPLLNIHEHTVTASVSGGNGTATPAAQLVKPGGAADVSIVPAAGYEVETVTLDGQAQSIPNRSGYALHLSAVSADHTIVATFSRIQPSFSDVTALSPYYAAIQGMALADVIGGYPDGTFRPLAPVLRAQFAKMAVGALQLSANEGMTSPFVDLGSNNPASLYPHEYVAAAYANGITQGLTATVFGPWENISRAQAVTMVVRAVQHLHPGWLQPVPDAYLNTWGTDFSPIHGPNSRIAEYNGLLAGLPLADAASDPWAPMSRGEVAQVLWNMMKMQD